MQNLQQQDTISSAFSVRKIPVSHKEEFFDTENNKYKDKIKIIELSNLIDKWEKELLFSDTGFYSLKGKEVENKSKEFIEELEKFIDSKISQTVFSFSESKEAANEIKNLKIGNIKKQMLNYESKELFNWEIDVYNQALDCSIQKALMYKNNSEVVANSFKNGIAVLNLMAEREQWNNKIKTSRNKQYKSDFYYALIKSFSDDKDIRFSLLYEKYKDSLLPEKQEELGKALKELKTDIIAYNWAKELFSYNLNDSENEREIRKINDKELEVSVRRFIEILKKQKVRNEQQKTDEAVEKSWQNILSLTDTEPDKAMLYIDLTQKQGSIKSQKDYILKLVKDGFITTDTNKYIELFKEMINDFDNFRTTKLYEYKSVLSEDDFEFFSNIQKEQSKELIVMFSDYKYFFDTVNKLKIKNSSKIYSLIKLLIQSLNQYKEINGKDADIEKRNKIITAIFERNSEQDKQKESKEQEKDDSIIDNTGK